MKKLVKKLSDSIFGNTCIEYVLDENHNYKEQYNANKDLFIYINGIQVGVFHLANCKNCNIECFILVASGGVSLNLY